LKPADVYLTALPKERDEGAADMFLNWVYRQVGQGGFVNATWAGITVCNATPAVQPPPNDSGDVRYKFMNIVVFPTLATRFPTTTPTPTP
jgi:hypothetical protein